MLQAFRVSFFRKLIVVLKLALVSMLIMLLITSVLEIKVI